MIRILANEPPVYVGVVQEQEEIAKSKASGELLTWGDLAKMKYTWSVAMETLRMHPPVLVTFRRAIQDIELEGYDIPKGWQIMTFATMTQMDAKNFPDPTKFDPRRLEKTSPPPYTLVPFGAGPRMCPGYEFARIATLVAIHYLVTHFTWKLCSTDLSFTREPMPNFHKGLEIQIDPKKVPPPEVH
uniref:Cytochrome P450 716B1-like n=1 Tax=Rhizophora mucronata TaxID=61149 RepID=A0A2P2N6L3_RHIMU